jgi:hypothetical protein
MHASHSGKLLPYKNCMRVSLQTFLDLAPQLTWACTKIQYNKRYVHYACAIFYPAHGQGTHFKCNEVSSGIPRNFVPGGGSTNSVEDTGQTD